MIPVQLIDTKKLPDTAIYQKFRKNPPDICLSANSAHCGIWWQRTPSPEDRLGLIGHYYTDNEPDSRALLDAACGYLRGKGCRRAIGPMDGNTWNAYRFVTFSDGSGPFLMEPQNPVQWPEYWAVS